MAFSERTIRVYAEGLQDTRVLQLVAIVNLRAILRAQGRRRPLTLRPIQTTQAQAKALQRIYAPIMQVWSVGVQA